MFRYLCVIVLVEAERALKKTYQTGRPQTVRGSLRRLNEGEYVADSSH